MKTRRIELRASPEFVQQLDDLAADMRCPVSSVIRRLVIAEHKRRFRTAMTAAPAVSVTAAGGLEGAAPPTTATPTTTTTLIPLDEADAATRMFIELGFPPEDFGVGGPTGPTEFRAPGS